MQDKVLIYIHGFLSSPQSVKAQATKNYIEQHFPQLTMEIPKLPNYPAEAMMLLENIVAKYQGKSLCFIGSSMGGYFSTYLVEKYGGKAVLINPAVKPYELLQDYLGPHENPYTGETFELSEQHTAELKRLDTLKLLRPKSYWALLQRGDEVLDYSQAVGKYVNAQVSIEDGGDHSFVGYENWLPQICEFLFDQAVVTSADFA